jgi:membrane associated rhomboid family serine protease
MLLPVGHENMESRRWPVITIGLIVVNVIVFLATNSTLNRESPELRETRVHIFMLAAMHPELEKPPAARQIVDAIEKQHHGATKAASDFNRAPEDVWDARMRLIEDPAQLQAEMDRLCARYDDLRSNSMLERYAFVPAHPTAMSYITANFLHGGWLHIIGNMWFLWLAGVVLEDAWGRWMYLAVYMVAGVFALQVHAWCNPESYTPLVGASGAVAGLMGAFLVRFPKVRIRMLWAWFFFFRIVRFSVEALWLLPAWLLMEIFYGTVFGSASGVAHMAHVGGFLFGMAAAAGIKYSGIESKINQKIEDQVDPTHEAELDGIHDLAFNAERMDDALVELERFIAAYPGSERALTLQQEIFWRKSDLKAYAAASQKLCEFHLAQGEIDRALKDYEDLVNGGGGLLPAKTWFKLCQSLEAKQEFERALGEYLEISYAYPQDRQSLLALMAGARVAMGKLKRPQQAMMMYQAVADSTVPHLDLDAAIQMGFRDARKAMETAPAQVS